MSSEFDFDKLLDDVLTADESNKNVDENDVDNILKEILGESDVKILTEEDTEDALEQKKVDTNNQKSEENSNKEFEEQFATEQKKLINDIGRLLEEKKNSAHNEIADEINKTIEQSKIDSEQKNIMFEKTSGFKKFDIDEFNMIFGSPDENINKGKVKKKKKSSKKDEFFNGENSGDILFASDFTAEIKKEPIIENSNKFEYLNEFSHKKEEKNIIEKAEAEEFLEDKKDTKDAKTILSSKNLENEEVIQNESSLQTEEALKNESTLENEKVLKNESVLKDEETLQNESALENKEALEEKEESTEFTKVIETNEKIGQQDLNIKGDNLSDSTVVRMNSIKNAVEDVKEKKGFIKNIMSSEEDEVDETLARDLGYFQSRKTIDEFEGPEDKESVKKSLEFQVKEALIKLITCIILTIPLLILTLCPAMKMQLPQFINPSENMFIYSVAISIFTGMLILCCLSTVFHGLSSAFRFKPDQETLVAMALITSFVHSAYVAITNPHFERLPFFYGGIAGVILIVNIIGKYLEAKVVLKNFGLVSSNHMKSAVILYDEDNFEGNFPFKYKENEEKACIGVNAKFVSDFLARSYSLENIERKIKPIHYFSFFLPIIVSAAKMILDKGNLSQLFWMLSFGFCICAPLASTLSYWLPVSKITKCLRKRGATLIGYGSIKKYKYIGAVTLSDKDLFRPKDITISALKFYEPTKIDEYITKIASLLNKTNSEMANVFMKILENNRNILLDVEDYSFDKGQGIMGYINGERILCGTRAYVESYGVKIPSDVREDNLPVSKKISYVSIDGKLVASFETNYKVTRSTYEMFREICKERLDIILYTMDYNLTEDLIRDLFAIEGSLVCVIDKTFIGEFEAMTKPFDRVKADIVSITGNKGIAFAVCKIPKISTVMSVGVLIKALTLIISLLIFCAVIFANGITAATPLHILIFQLVWLLPYLFIYLFSK